MPIEIKPVIVAEDGINEYKLFIGKFFYLKNHFNELKLDYDISRYDLNIEGRKDCASRWFNTFYKIAKIVQLYSKDEQEFFELMDKLYKSHKDYKYWGGNGVTVCESWLNDYAQFLKDMGRKPSKKHSIDRINPFGNYEPSNCRWATSKEQALNKRKNHGNNIGISRG
jgi:hypothetical protein